MKSELIRSGLRAANTALNPFHLRLIRTWEKREDFSEFIPWRQTLHDAAQAGMPLSEYIDARYNADGVTQKAVDQMAAFGVFDGEIRRVCEIGPGSGRYLERVMRSCHPREYEIYETAEDWRRWLVQTFGVTAQPTDGRTLRPTLTASVDLVHANKVFPGLSILDIFGYFREMLRVVRPGGALVFDVLTEDSFTQEKLDAWLESGIRYPSTLVPRAMVLDCFERGGCRLLGESPVPMRPGTTEMFAFRKDGSLC